MILSIHIPKTAGVSIRNILKEHYGPGFVLHYWQITDAWGRVVEKIPAGAKCVHGHYQTDQLTGLFPKARLITWVRNPVERVVSSYYHRLRDPDWKHPVCQELHQKKLSLAEYAALPLVRNEMTRFFGSKKPEDFHFIGLVEEFEESLVQMKQILGISGASPRRDNVNPGKKTDRYKLAPEAHQAIQQMNELDVSLYDVCVQKWSQTGKVGAAGGKIFRGESMAGGPKVIGVGGRGSSRAPFVSTNGDAGRATLPQTLKEPRLAS